MPESLSFPPGFLWGSATSSYQVEGGNNNNDWHLWEKQGKVPFVCAQAADSYHRFREDFDIAKSLGHNAHRLSFEWSRIHPEKDLFDYSQIQHYKDVIAYLNKINIKPVVTLHHFTNPIWFYDEGCWLNPESSDIFCRYVTKIAEHFSGLIDYWITINEPLVYVYNSYIKGIWPPGLKSLNKALVSLKNIEKAHIEAYHIIHKHNKNAMVSIAKHIRVFSPCDCNNFGQNLLPAFLRNRLFNFKTLELFARKKVLDFIGLNYYTKDFVRFSIKDIFGKNCLSSRHAPRKNSLGWYVEPKALFNVLLRLKRFRLPVFVTENGTTEAEDYLYEDYLKKHLFFIAESCKAGVNIIGYLWWSLIDNFEWDKGFKPKFGLVEVDENLNRRIKPFAFSYKQVCLNNKLELNV